MAAHLGDETIAAYVDGLLDSAAIARADEHIAACATCRAQLSAVAGSPSLHSFIAGAASTVAATAATAVALPELANVRAGDPVPDAQLGRYIVGSVIGRGAMGVVVRARDPELERDVAIKLVDARRSGGAWRARLRAEARAMAKLRHPNVIAVHDAGAVGEQPFVAMELVDGESLGRWRKGRSQREILTALVAAARGLSAAHAAGLIHGDVKPDNILVDRAGRAQIGDFGLARAIQAEPPAGEHVLAGTPAYLAPELWRGGAPDVASDQFAFAVTAYETLCGTRPWSITPIAAAAPNDALEHARTAPSPVDAPASPLLDEADRASPAPPIDAPVRAKHEPPLASIHAIERAITTQPPAPPPVPRRIARVLLRGLARDPVARYPSLDAFAADLERASRSRAWVAGVAAGVVALGVVGFVITRDRDDSCPDPGARVPAVSAAELCGPAPSPACSSLAAAFASRGDAWRATHVEVCRATREGTQSGEQLERRMRCLDQRIAEQRALLASLGTHAANPAALDGLSALLRLGRPEDCATSDAGGRAAPATPAVTAARAAIANARAAFALGHYRAGVAALAPSWPAIQQLGHPELVADAANVLGQLYVEVADLAAAERTFDTGMRAAAEAGDDTASAMLLIELAKLVGDSRQQWTRGAELLRAANTAVVRAGKPAALEARFLMVRGLMSEDTNELDAALRDYQRALALSGSESIDAPDRPSATLRASAEPKLSIDATLALQRVCGVEHALGKLPEARAHCQSAVDATVRLLGPDHPYVAEAESNLAVAYAVGGDLKAARARWEAALAILDRGGGGGAHGLSTILLNLEAVSADLHDAAAAERYLGRAIATSADARTNPESLGIRVRIAKQLHARGSSTEALAMLRDTIARAEALLGPTSTVAANAYEAMSYIAHDLQHFADAAEADKRAAEQSRAIYGEHSPTTLSNEGRYAQELIVLGRTAEALPILERNVRIFEATQAADSALLAAEYTNLADATLSAGDGKRALEMATKAVAIYEKRGDDPLQLSEARFLQGQARWKVDRSPDAVAIVRHARDEMRAIGPRAATLPDVEKWLAGTR